MPINPLFVEKNKDLNNKFYTYLYIAFYIFFSLLKYHQNEKNNYYGCYELVVYGM